MPKVLILPGLCPINRRMKSILPIALLMIVLAGCADEQPSASGRAGAPAGAQDTVSGTPGTFYKHYVGTMGDRRITFNLEQYGSESAAGYYELSTRKPIKLIPVKDGQNAGLFHFCEMNGTAPAANWELNVSGNTLRGKRIAVSGNLSAAVSLQEAYPEGCYRLLSYYLKDTGRLFRNFTTPMATVAYGMLWPAASVSGEDGAFLRSRITLNMHFEGAEGVAEGLKTRAFRYFSGYRNELRTIVDTAWPAAQRADIAYHYNSTFLHHVVYNDGQWLVLENIMSTYTGGAHGTYSSGFQNLDMKEHREWALADVVEDTASVRPYIELAIRDYFRISATEDLSSRLLLSEVTVPGNFYISPSGLTFVYNPYELASYSDGEIHLFISYEKLLPLLTPEFKKRIGSGPSSGVALNASCGSAHRPRQLSTKVL